MPNYTVGNLWDEVGKADMVLVTTNSTVTKAGELVMGRGAALEAKNRYTNLAKELGKTLIDLKKAGGVYGIIFGMNDGITEIGAFQVKYHWKEEASLPLIAYSTGCLEEMSAGWNRIAMNFPGIGNGRLSKSEVKPFLDTLPDNVYIYTKE